MKKSRGAILYETLAVVYLLASVLIYCNYEVVKVAHTRLDDQKKDPERFTYDGVAIWKPSARFTR